MEVIIMLLITSILSGALVYVDTFEIIIYQIENRKFYLKYKIRFLIRDMANYIQRG